MNEADKTVANVEKRIAMIEKEQVQALADQAARLSVQYEKEIEDIKIDAERFYKEAISNLKGGVSPNESTLLASLSL